MKTAEAKALRKQKRKRNKLYNKLHPKIRDYTLYALKLVEGKYYIGLTARADVLRRYNEHAKGKGAVWTKIYKPVEVMETRKIGVMKETDAVNIETMMTVEYIDKYGISNVRGGSLCFTDELRCLKSYQGFKKNRGLGVKSRRQEKKQEQFQRELGLWLQTII